MKTISYVDFFKKQFVLVLKSLKLHDCPIYDDFTQVFEDQNIYVDDFYSSRMSVPNFSPDLLHPLDKALLSNQATGYFLGKENIQDGYVSHFYSVIFEDMRYSAIEDNFVKAKIGDSMWKNFSKELIPSSLMLDNIRVYMNVETSLPIMNFSRLIAPSDHKQMAQLFTVAAIGIKSEFRGAFWENIVSQRDSYQVKQKLDVATPLIIQ